MSETNFFDLAYSIENDEEAKAMYAKWAAVYDRDLDAVDYQQPTRCAAALSGQLENKNASILDIGCGTGLAGLALKRAGYTGIDGCDLSEEMLEKAIQIDVYIRLFTCNLNEPPLDVPDDFYDALTAVGVFSFGHVKADALDEFLRIAKNGAPIIIGLNDHFYKEGSLTAKIDALEKDGLIEVISKEHGEHIPANDLKGWVITLKKV